VLDDKATRAQALPRPKVLARRPAKAQPRRQDRRASGLPGWWPWPAVGVAAAVIGIVVAVLLLRGREEPPPEDNGPPVPVQPVPVQPSVTPPQDNGPPANQPGGPAEPEKADPPLRPVYAPRMPGDPATLRQEFEGAPAALPAPPPADAVVLRVSRLPAGPDTFRSLADALAKAPPGKAVILEIHDNGPLFEPALPAVSGRSLVIRAGKGYRPLLAWDLGARGGGPADRLLELTRGSLTLDGLDVVVKWTLTEGGRTPALFRVRGGSLAARDCTFSVAGRHPQGIAAVWLEGVAPQPCRLSHCYLRGADLVGLRLDGSGADVLLDDCLIAGEEQPLCDVTCGDDLVPAVRLVRSTLVGGTALLQVRPMAGAAHMPRLRVLCCDSLLAQGNPQAEAVMVRLPAGSAGRMSWRVLNCVYAGWKQLLAAGDRTIPASNADAWRQEWGYDEGDAVLLDTWPRAHHPAPEDVAAAAYDTAGTRAHFASLTGPGPLGCDLGTLPPGRSGWPALTYDRMDLALPPLPSEDAPPIPAARDGLYHGERLSLDAGVDLGQVLQDRLARLRPAPRVVLHLAGSGEHLTSPIRLRGVSLVLYFERPAGKAEPLALVPTAGSAADHEALLQVDGGDLELLGARIVFPASLAAVPRHVLQVRGGDLRLAGCHLQGPLAAPAEGYQGLIDFHGSGKPAGETRACVVNQSALLSARTVLRVHEGGLRLRFHQSVVLAADDGLRLDLTAPTARPNVQCALESTTVAVRGVALDLHATPAPSAPPEPVLVRTDASLFLAPLGDGPPRATLLRCDRLFLTHGLLVWQGQGNGFDRQRLHAYVTTTGGTPPAQPFHVWSRLWGTPGEQAPLLIDLPKARLQLTPPPLRQLALPPTIRPHAGEALPGADLARLGIVSGKK
jgi:hypothetical protein